MIIYPKMKAGKAGRQKLEVFKGYNHNLRIGSGEFYEMENLTSDDYPVLSTRKRRGRIVSYDATGCKGMYFVPGTGLFHVIQHEEEHGSWAELLLLKPSGESSVLGIELNTDPKQFALIGKMLIIVPDMVAVDIDTLEYEKLERIFHIKSKTYFQICKEDGSPFSPMVVSNVSPSDPWDGDYWLSVNEQENCLMQYSATMETWSRVDSTWVKISSAELRKHPFHTSETITFSGIGMKNGETTNAALSGLNGDHSINCVGDDCIVIKGFVTDTETMDCDEESSIQMLREVPKLDLVVESGNRLWGCKKDYHEIYACKLGEWRNWNCFQGLSTDSWVGSVGTPGEFTGAVVQNGYPIFYKENCKHKVWPSSTGAHQMTTVNCNGVEKGSESSLAVCDGTVFYKSAFGVFADDGGGAVEIGKALGDVRYYNAIGAIHDRKYYLSMEDHTGQSKLFVYDIDRRMWHREKSEAGFLCSAWNSLYCVAVGEVIDLTGSTGTPEEEVSWMAVTGDLGLELPEQKYVSRLTLRLSMEPGATLEIYAQYDRQQEWVKLGQAYGTNLRSFSLPVRPRRCDQLRLKLQGTGTCKIYSITKTLEKGSELS